MKIVVKVWCGASAKKGTKLKIKACDPLSVLFEGYCKAKKVDETTKSRGGLAMRQSGPSGRLDLGRSAASLGIGDGAELDLVVD